MSLHGGGPWATLKERELTAHLLEAQKQEELLWCRKSCITWLRIPALSTRFFHLSTIIRCRRNCMEALQDSSGAWLRGRQAIGQYVEDYFKGLFTGQQAAFPHQLENIIPETLKHEDNDLLCRLPDELEIWAAIKNIGDMKALGPDGFTRLFYQRYWDTVDREVIRMVQIFFLTVTMRLQSASSHGSYLGAPLSIPRSAMACREVQQSSATTRRVEGPRSFKSWPYRSFAVSGTSYTLISNVGFLAA